MTGSTGSFAQTPDVLSRFYPGRKWVSLQRSPSGKEAVFVGPDRARAPVNQVPALSTGPGPGAETLPAKLVL